jgi:hypothetical protein
MTKTNLCIISGFHCSVNEICAIMGFYTALKMKPVGCPKTLVTNYHSTLYTIPEVRRSKNRSNVLNTVTTLKTAFKVTSSQQQQQVLLQNVNYYQITWHHIPGDTTVLSPQQLPTQAQCILFRARDNKDQKPLTLSVLYCCIRNP